MSDGFYRPADVARLLKCSEWWVKEQARQRRIPFCWIGGSYLFTDDHVNEIVRLFEVQPVDSGAPVADVVPARKRREERVEVTLRAREPRRSRQSHSDNSTAA